MFEDTKGVNRRTDNTLSKRKQRKGQTQNNIQNTTQKSKDRATRIPLPGLNSGRIKQDSILTTENNNTGKISSNVQVV